MRILLFAGKGGVGKTSVAAGTGILLAERGLKTLVMSLDPAHSLSDAFDLDKRLMDVNRGRPVAVADRLWIQELDVHEEIEKHWGEVHQYLSLLLNVSGLDQVLAEELAILPGMEEVSALLHVNRYARDRAYDVLILDCAPTAESIRFVSVPKALEWYMEKIFRMERTLFRVARPMVRRVSDVPLPEDAYFESIQRLFHRLRGVDTLLSDSRTTSVRLVTNLEKMVIRETQRSFMFFSLHQLNIDAIMVNRVLHQESDDPFVKSWVEQQRSNLQLVTAAFQPLPVLQAPYYERETLGYERLKALARAIYGDTPPHHALYRHQPVSYAYEDGRPRVHIHFPFVSRHEIQLTKVGDELIIRMGAFKKKLVLPRAFARLEPEKARLEEDTLTITFGGDHGP
ncbi:arsenite-transporting ATPase [Desulfacinum hydrothermale DSM 13146]|uniref:arsenite-transporting ATPase n=1 Tax=Desulfacinum hydrothermale DSM 13146 TaxID=1121390 RepID=A0A1W1WYH6_9BACT|nr:TRC40/GET3/ArsA family transport-energizing ATPase [Desulfacinum hydrothermale]SMC16704.1 arsenite-transporting ATPase [Desulfacinum hydrothermale DSM 13146]